MSESKGDSKTDSAVSSSSSSSSSSLTSSPANSRGIPTATFIEDVPSYLQSHGLEAESVLRQLQSLYGKYKFMESQLVQQQKALLQKLPEISNALTSVRFIQRREEEFTVQFELADSVYCSAAIAPASTPYVLLWLGANVMLEYGLQEAVELLERNRGNAEATLATLEADLGFLKDQITVSEVNIARVHNVNVGIKQERRKRDEQHAIAEGKTLSAATAAAGR